VTNGVLTTFSCKSHCRSGIDTRCAQCGASLLMGYTKLVRYQEIPASTPAPENGYGG